MTWENNWRRCKDSDYIEEPCPKCNCELQVSRKKNMGIRLTCRCGFNIHVSELEDYTIDVRNRLQQPTNYKEEEEE